MSVYAPTLTSSADVKDKFYDDLSSAIGNVPDIHSLFILGDFNAHSPAWFSSTGDSRAAARGEAIFECLNDSSLALLNDDSPTRVPKSGPNSSPDLTIVSAHMATVSRWQTLTTLNSDHLPIFIELGGCYSTSTDPLATKPQF